MSNDFLVYIVVIEFNLIISKCYQNSLYKPIHDIYNVNNIIYTLVLVVVLVSSIIVII